MSPTFEQLREGYLHHIEEKGQDIMRESLEDIYENNRPSQMADLLPVRFAADTLTYSLDAKNELIAESENKTEKDAAEMVGYELREKARKSGVKNINTESTDEDEIDLNNFGIDAKIRNWDSWLSDIYREFSRIDYLNRGLSEHKMENRPPKEIIKEVTDTEKWIVEEDDAGELYMEGIYTIDEDWIDYRRGKKPAAYNEEVVEYLRELGVGE